MWIRELDKEQADTGELERRDGFISSVHVFSHQAAASVSFTRSFLPLLLSSTLPRLCLTSLTRRLPAPSDSLLLHHHLHPSPPSHQSIPTVLPASRVATQCCFRSWAVFQCSPLIGSSEDWQHEAEELQGNGVCSTVQHSAHHEQNS